MIALDFELKGMRPSLASRVTIGMLTFHGARLLLSKRCEQFGAFDRVEDQEEDTEDPTYNKNNACLKNDLLMFDLCYNMPSLIQLKASIRCQTFASDNHCWWRITSTSFHSKIGNTKGFSPSHSS
jgi:hypothetical protein